MLAKLQTEIPRGEGWTYEPKWDGFRTIVTSTPDGVRFVSRDDRPMMRFFPEIEALVSSATPGTYVGDGEIVLVCPEGLAFEMLQLRLHPAESRVRKLAAEIPASLILFDLLEWEGVDLRDHPLAERREGLEAAVADWGLATVPERLEELRPGPEALVTPWTDDLEVAERWFADEAGLGQDGILAKRADQAYEPGVRGWVKVKHRKTADCVVGGYRVAKNDDGVGSLLLGLYDADGQLHYVGHTSSFKAAERRAIRAELAPLEGVESFYGGREPGGPSRWSAGKDTAFVSVEPVRVCEVSFDRMQGGRFRHAATFVRWREDRRPASCTFEQLGETPPSWG